MPPLVAPQSIDSVIETRKHISQINSDFGASFNPSEGQETVDIEISDEAINEVEMVMGKGEICEDEGEICEDEGGKEVGRGVDEAGSVKDVIVIEVEDDDSDDDVVEVSAADVGPSVRDIAITQATKSADSCHIEYGSDNETVRSITNYCPAVHNEKLPYVASDLNGQESAEGSNSTCELSNTLKRKRSVDDTTPSDGQPEAKKSVSYLFNINMTFQNYYVLYKNI